MGLLDQYSPESRKVQARKLEQMFLQQREGVEALGHVAVHITWHMTT